MRLDEEERRALRFALRDVEGEAYLYGSRVADSRRGGDIDVLIFSDEDPFDLSRRVAVDFFERCEEKIDVLVIDRTKMTPEQEAFVGGLEKVRLQL